MAEESANGITESLDRLLADLRALSEDVTSLAVLSKDGELRSSSHAPGVDRDRASAMLSALVNLADRSARENGKESASQVRVKAEDGYLLLVRLGSGGALAATTDLEARVGLVIYDMKNARGEVEKVLGGKG